MKKETKKSSKKTKEPKFIVNLTDTEESIDTYAEFAFAKQRAGLPLTDAQLNAVIALTVNTVKDYIISQIASNIVNNGKSIEINDGEKLIFDSKGNVEVKKPNIFKRFWNWITKKK